MTRFFSTLLFSLCVSSLMAHYVQQDTLKTKAKQLDARKAVLKEIASLPKTLKEASGLQFINGRLWSHNDDGIPALYCIDSVGNLIRAVQVNSLNRGWEDLAQDEKGNVYIGSFGNNKNDKRDLKIYRISAPDSISTTVAIPDLIQYTYSDQKHFPPDKTNKNFDVDAFFHWEGALWLFTKNRTTPFNGYSKVYKLPAEPGPQTAQLVDSLYVGNGPMINNWITSADISPDKKTVALLFHDRIWFLRNIRNEQFSKAAIFELTLNHYSHKAGITFKENSAVYIVDEFEANILGGKLYSLDLRGVLKDMKP
jgi:hypothetical protein